MTIPLPHTDVNDTEFQKLVIRHPVVDLMAVALELARDVFPELEFSSVRSWIAERAGELAAPFARSQTESDALKQLGHCLTEKNGLCGETDESLLAEAGYLNRVIETGRGTSLSLSLIAMAVAERLGLELCGVDAPLRFLTRLETVEGPLFLDLFAGGCVLTWAECLQTLCDQTGLPAESVQASLKPVESRVVVIRMLHDLKNAHVLNENWQAAWKMQQRLATLQPTSYTVRRDLAMLSLEADRPGQAVDLLEACLRVCPPAEKLALQQQLTQARDRLSVLN